MLELHPDTIHGGPPLSDEQRRAYIEYHRARNAVNLRESRRLGHRSRRPAGLRPVGDRTEEPWRRIMYGFFAGAYKRLSERFGGLREKGGPGVTILDLGCGGGSLAGVLAAAGATGRYIGVDLVPRSSWFRTERVGGLDVEFVAGDVHELDTSGLPGVDLLVSASSLQQFSDEGAVLARFEALLTDLGTQLHVVPAPGALGVFGPSGYRQYTPLCLSRLLPYATVYRLGGALGRWRGPGGVAMPLTGALDRALGCPAPTMYGVSGVDLHDPEQTSRPDDVLTDGAKGISEAVAA